MKITITGVAVVLLLACGGKEYSFQTVEDARAQAKENAVQNAQTYRAENSLADLSIYARGDSTIAPDCPNGDGWASIDLRTADGKPQLKLKCSTVSFALGCMTETDFKSKAYANEDGRCQPLNKVPHPLPKLAR
jgi:hypothetical protein